MVGAVGHRGPDARGVVHSDRAGLGHARLSIIDVAGGAQPMSNDDGSITISFNGEIFNYRELRDDLARRGQRFVTSSDTEVALRAYEAMGADCVSAFNGDFALAILDRRLGRLMLARDRMGVRPLFYAERDGVLYFASEIKALLRVPGMTAALDPVALDQIFSLWCTIAPRTAFKGINELPPAHTLIADAGHTAVRPYWQLSFPRGDDFDRRSEATIADELRALLLDSINIRLRSDVPVGAYLSGGLDSSIIAAGMKRMVPDRLRTFSVAFETAEFDESEFQRALVDHLATDHTQILCTTADIARDFPDAIWHAEKPILRTAPTPLFCLSRQVHAQGFKVVLTGEGADEIFAGYDIFKEAKLRRFCARQPQSQRRPLLLRRLYPYLPNLKGQSQRYLEAFFGTDHRELADPLFSHLPRLRNTAAIKAFYSGDTRAALAGYDALAELREALPTDFAQWHPLCQAQYLETAHLLPGYILSSQGDRMAMAHAVEGRFPFLDHRLVEFAARIPPKLKIKGLREKHLLREATKDMLPPEILQRPKQPYRAPESQSFVRPSAPGYVGTVMAAATVTRSGIFDGKAVERLYRKCASRPVAGFRDNAAFIGILSTQLWQRRFVENAREPSDLDAAVA